MKIIHFPSAIVSTPGNIPSDVSADAAIVFETLLSLSHRSGVPFRFQIPDGARYGP